MKGLQHDSLDLGACGERHVRGCMFKGAVILALLVVNFMIVYSTNTLAGEVCTPIQLTYSQSSAPQVSGDRVVWQHYDGSDAELFMWTPSDGVNQLTDNEDQDSHARLSGDRVVWQSGDGSWGPYSSDDIYTWQDGDLAPTRLTNNAYLDAAPQVSGDYVVWMGYDGSDDEIFTWTPAGGVVQLTNNSDDDVFPEVSGDRVVWYREVPEGEESDGFELVTWTPSGGVVQICDFSPATDNAPRVSGDRIVWERYDGSDTEIFTWTPSDGICQLTDNNYPDEAARVSGDRVLWGVRYGGYEVYDVFTWSPSEGATQLATSASDLQLSGERVVWIDGSQIFTWTPSGGASQLTDSADRKNDLQVCDNRLAWLILDAGGVGSGVFTAEIADVATRYDDKDPKITYEPAWNRWDASGYWAATNDTYAFTDQAGRKAIVTFDGTYLSWISRTANTQGKAQVTLYDGDLFTGTPVDTQTIDLFSQTTNWKKSVYSTGLLEDGTHTVVIECLGEKNWSSYWYSIGIDGFDVVGTLVQSPTVTKIDDNDYSYFTYDPGIATGASSTEWSRWDDSGYWAAYLDTYAFTDVDGFKTTFTFDGTYASWIAATSNTKGKAQVSLYEGDVDPGNLLETQTVDLYSSSTQWKQSVYDTGILPAGTYNIVIECLYEKNPASYWYTIDVDRFDVMLTP